MTETALLAGDVDAIKEFVFETSFLPQIRGGSQLLIDCEKEIKEYVRGIKGSKTIYCEGGSFLVEIPSGEIEKAKSDTENFYPFREGSRGYYHTVEDIGLLKELGIDPGETESVKLVNNQIESLRRFGLVEETTNGWRWIK